VFDVAMLQLCCAMVQPASPELGRSQPFCWGWTHLTPGIQAGLYLVAVAAGLTALCALAGIAATSPLTRWLPIRPGHAPGAAAVAGLGAVGADALGVALLAAELIAAPEKLSPIAASVAVAASIIRLTLARRAASRCLTIRAGAAGSH
jgi:hypothetical protein